MSVTSRAAIRYGQWRAEQEMADWCVIDRPGGTEIDDDGREQTTYTLIYEGPMEATSFRPHEENPDVGSGTATLQRTYWFIPAVDRMAYLVRRGRVLAWDGPTQVGDRMRRTTPGKPVKTVRLTGEHDVTWPTAQKLGVDEITGGVWS